MTAIKVSTGHKARRNVQAFKSLSQQDRVRLLKKAGIWSWAVSARSQQHKPRKAARV